MRSPHPFTFLTREEWKLVFSVAFLSVADTFTGAYEIHRYATRSEEGGTRDWCELFLRAVRFLALEHGMEFKALQVHRSGQIDSADPVEPGNEMYVVLLDAGGLPDLPSAFEAAIRLAEQRLPSLDTEPLKQALSKVRGDLRLALATADPDPEVVRKIREHRQEARAAAFRAMENTRIH